MPLNSFFSRINIFRRTRKELKNKTDELKKFRLALDQAPAAVYIINKNMIFEYANPEFTRQSGYTQEDVIQKHVINSIYKGEIPENRRAIVEALGKGITWQGELYSQHKTGRMYWANTIASPYKNDFGEVDGYIVIQQDVTEQKKMAEALKESEDLYRNLIENSLEGMALTQDGKMLYINQSFINMLGYSLEDLMTIEPSLILAPEDRERVLDLHYKRMKGELDNYTYNSDFIRKDGSRFTAEMNSAKVQINGKNASLVTLRDITQRLKIQQSLHESETKYKALVENSQDGITIVRDNKYLFANQTFCKMIGYSIEELYNMPSILTIHPDDRDKAMEQANRRRNLDFSTITIVYRMLTKSGEVRECETTSTLVEYNGIWASFYTSHDITESKRIQIKLKESEEKYRQLVESTNSIILKWDKNFNITFLNEYGLSFFGFSRNEIIDKPMIGTIVPNSEEVSGRNLELLMNDIFNNPEKYANNINENSCKNGKRVWISWNNTAVKDNNNNTISIFSVGTNITENIRIQNDLKESEEKYRQLFAAESDAIFMIDAESGEILDVNPAASRIYGYSLEEFLQMKNTDVSAEPEKTIESTKQNQTLVPLRYHKKKNGSIFPVELSAGFTTIKNKKIQIVTSRDITERIKIQQALSLSEEKYRSLIESANDGVIITQDGLLKFANKAMCNMMQYSLDELVDKSFFEFVPVEEHLLMKDYHNRRMNGEVFNVLYRSRLIQKNGNIINIELNSRTEHYNNKPAAFIIIRDITERVKIEMELKIAKEELELLNHDLENRIVESSQKLTEANTLLFRVQKENLQSQFEVLRQQVNPHFLFNSLNVLTSLIKLEPDLAEKFTEHLSKVYRYVLENKDNDMVSLSTELDFLDAYIFLLNIRFMDKIKVEININIDKNSYLILPLALQLIIENAIKHNSMSKKNPLTIQLFIDEKWMLNIINNLQERESNMVSTGVGLSNIAHRYQLLELPAPEFYKTATHFVAKIPLTVKE